MFDQVIAADWSGQEDLTRQREDIWFCRVSASGDLELNYGLSREELFSRIVTWKAKSIGMLVGLHFPFSFPHSFVREHGGSAPAFWQRVAGEGERWLNDCRPPFFVKNGAPLPTPATDGHFFRLTDKFVDEYAPTSPFQIAAANSTASSSLRGIPYLPLFIQQGFRVWPFQRPAQFTIVEIYPRYFTAAFPKNSPLERRAALARLRAQHPMYARLTERQATCVELSEHAFDALVAGIELWRRSPRISHLDAAADETTLLEGCIFAPPLAAQPGM
jgi:hypothetical protein